MAKKTAKKKAAPQPRKVVETAGSNKARVELRFEEDVFQGIRSLAEKSEISVNQLLHGLARWAVTNGMPGELVKENEFFVLRNQPGCVSFGAIGKRYSDNEREILAEHRDCDVDAVEDYPGKLHFVLDYTVRRVVREED